MLPRHRRPRPVMDGSCRERGSRGRFRIVCLLGRGGMGEVYRADDLKLWPPGRSEVSAAEFSMDARGIEYFLNEVRLARQSHTRCVSCIRHRRRPRYPLLSMELSTARTKSLLRRIGRLSNDKGIDIARQLCVGLSAGARKRCATSRLEARQRYDRRTWTSAHYRFWASTPGNRSCRWRHLRPRQPIWPRNSFPAERPPLRATSIR